MEMLHQIARGEGFGLDRRPGHPPDEADLRRARLGRPEAHDRHRHGGQGARVLAVHVEGVARAAGRLRPDEQGAAARRGVAHLHGHGQQAHPDLRGEGRGALLLPALPDVVRPATASASSPGTTSSRRTTPSRPSRPRSPSTSTTTARSPPASPASRSRRKRSSSSRRRSTTSSASSTCGAGYGRREHDWPPYRSVGPVTVEEYESRAERYDKQMLEEIGVDPAGKSVEEKIAITRKYREDRYSKLWTRSTSAAAGRRTASRRWRRSRSSGSTSPRSSSSSRRTGADEVDPNPGAPAPAVGRSGHPARRERRPARLARGDDRPRRPEGEELHLQAPDHHGERDAHPARRRTTRRRSRPAPTSRSSTSSAGAEAPASRCLRGGGKAARSKEVPRDTVSRSRPRRRRPRPVLAGSRSPSLPRARRGGRRGSLSPAP